MPYFLLKILKKKIVGMPLKMVYVKLTKGELEFLVERIENCPEVLEI